jgi:hypothetical protein
VVGALYKFPRANPPLRQYAESRAVGNFLGTSRPLLNQVRELPQEESYGGKTGSPVRHGIASQTNYR